MTMDPPEAAPGLGYARALSEPRSRKEGLLNFVQMAINANERGDTREATLLLVDLLDTIAGKANPFADITDSLSLEAVAKEIAAVSRAHATQLVAAENRGYQHGREAMKAEFRALLAPEPAAAARPIR